MKHIRIVGWMFALAATAGAAAAAETSRPAPVAIHSVSVNLPTSTAEFPAGPGSELTGKCLICHSAGMVLKQPRLSEAQWRDEINKMRNAYGAPIEASEVDTLATYMSKVNAAQQSN